MAHISPKLLQKAIHTSRKLALFTASTAALLLSSSGALANVAPNGVIVFSDGAKFSDDDTKNTWHSINDDGTDTGVAFHGPYDGYAITFGGNYTVNADVATIIQAININGTTPKVFMISKNMTIGSIITNAGGKQLPISIQNVSLTLNDTDATAADNGFDAATNTYTV